MCWADVDACWFQSDIDSVGTVIAFGGGVSLRVDIKCIVGTGLHAGLASNAAAVVKINDAVFALIER